MGGVERGTVRTSLTIPEVARSVNCSEYTVRAAIDRGELKAWRPAPTIWRIEPEALEAWRKGTPRKPRSKVDRLRAVER